MNSRIHVFTNGWEAANLVNNIFLALSNERFCFMFGVFFIGRHGLQDAKAQFCFCMPLSCSFQIPVEGALVVSKSMC